MGTHEKSILNTDKERVKECYLDYYTNLRKRCIFSAHNVNAEVAESFIPKYFNTRINGESSASLLYLPEHYCYCIDFSAFLFPLFGTSDTLIVSNHKIVSNYSNTSIYHGNDIGITNTGPWSISLIIRQGI